MASRQTTHYSVIVPAYRENGNIRPLITRIFAALRRVDSPVPAEQTEVIIVDDNSRDGSAETVQQLQQEGYNVRIIVRTTERGLSSAVVRGFQEAQGDNMLCMDADLQHPPEYVPSMLAAMSPSHTFVLGTRYGKGVEMDKDWPVHRRIISAGARVLALPLTTASDPMSGFFGIRKEAFLKARNLNAGGFKIALDLLIKSQIPPHAIAEVPFSFGVRAEGESKLTGKVMIKYLEQLAELYWYKFSSLLVFLVIFLIVAFFVLVRTWFGSPSLDSQQK
ncbi:glycosyltransferase family 2 protein [Phanerochaete carnosa HHB-10118-sp]|uniref:Dolichol-phosphate mannosyltransferase subunit 1 n=1 Tax=Phanerochaete carnosa (strain HHB-10118-sp) TaxID=650164 RepID=K5WS74_PHACS|nr:glycosyltransferase family 2 protein [Phanerochaete carnosa HHB-10118-sp]EKM53252.1 glycosyltransferase family 2 protein [Phanerochaete carnosa HHB-10118-sp]